jgi:hypothetical protein|tara:strand:+ start:1435 stop:1611 length:177 start_codon:yes stop_codon:yes gene_type:complete
MFIYSLANELKKSVSELCQTLTLEEMIGWAAFFELKHEEQKKDDQKVQQRRSVIPKSR